MNNRLRDFVHQLLVVGAVKFGEFTLKSGVSSPVYVDLRLLRSYPDLLEVAADLLWGLTQECASFERIADVPTAGTPFASAMVVLYKTSMITPRQPKGYGTEVEIEGAYKADDRVVVIDDVITTADSKLALISILESAGLTVEDICVLIDRGQGGREALAKAGYNLHSACTLRDILFELQANPIEGVTPSQVEEVLEYLDNYR